MTDDWTSNTDVETSSEGDSFDSRQEEGLTGEAFEIVAAPRRRILLTYLQSRSDDTVDVDDLVDAVVEQEYPDPGPADHRGRVAIDLHHLHLPKLAEAGVIDYDPLDETVRYRASEVLESLLAAGNEFEERER